MKYLVYLVVSIILINVSCRTPSVPVVTVTERERVVRVVDSAAMFALMECDSTNKVIMQSYSLKCTPNIRPSLSFDSGKISLSIVNIRDSIIYNYKDSIIFVPQYDSSSKTDYLTIIVAAVIAAFVVISVLIKRLV